MRTYGTHATTTSMKILVHVKLHKHADAVIELEGGEYEVHTSQPPVDGRANDNVIRQIAEHFGVSRSQVKLLSGAASKIKTIEIS